MSRGNKKGGLGSWKARFPLAVLNATAEVIPPYAVMQLGAGTNVGTDTIYNVVKPNGSTTAKYVVNSPASIAVAGYGAATDFYPADALITGSPAFNQEVGPVAGSWSLSVNGKGFISLGGFNFGAGRVASKGGTTAGDDFPLVKISNQSGTTKLAGSIVGYGTPLDPPPAFFNRVPTFNSIIPTAGVPFCVLLNDAAPGNVVDAGPVGIVFAQIVFTDLSHGFAEVITGDYQKLQSATTGQAKIIHRERELTAGNGTFGQQWAQIRIDPKQTATTDDTRGISQGSIASASTTSIGGPIVPGIGYAKLYDPPTGAAGVAWQPQPTPVTVENWMFASIADNKPLLLRKSRLDQNNTQIYVVISEGCKVVTAS